MANRRLLNPRGLHHRLPKAWLLTLGLALVSCLISIQCASFDDLPEDREQRQAWLDLKHSSYHYHKPDFLFKFNDRLDRPASGPPELASSARYLSYYDDLSAAADDKPQVPPRSALDYGENQPGRPLLSLLSSLSSDPSSLLDLDEKGNDNESNSNLDLFDSEEDIVSRLKELITGDAKQLPTPSITLGDLKDTDEKDRFLYLPDQSSSEQQQQLPDITDFVAKSSDDSNETSRDALATADSADAKANLTTLLEDDSEQVNGSYPISSTTTTTTTTTTETPKIVKTVTINSSTNDATLKNNTWGSMIGGMLKSLVNYVPYLGNYWNNKANKTVTIIETLGKANDSDRHTKPSDISEPTRESNDKHESVAAAASSHQVVSSSPSVVTMGAVGGDFKRMDQQLPRVSLMRQSSLAPIGYTSSDQLISMDEASHNTLSDYLMNQAVEQQQQQQHTYRHLPYQLFQASSPYMRHYRPGDDVYGSYTQPSPSLRPPPGIFGSHQDMLINPNGNSNNKTNDIYFLVMVGAFCMMAVAMVLSAGLFAYRVQQSRKMASEQDYPTYGVVGPNNINGKCGSASFMGSYFTGSPGLASTSASSSKTASAKYLPDYADATGMNTKTGAGMKGRNNDLGCGPNNTSVAASAAAIAAAANSGVGRSSSGFMVDNQNAARMYHYQHQKQQMIISDRTSAGRHTSASDLDSEDENDDGSYTVYECPGLASAHEMEIKNPLFNDDRTP